MSVKIPDIPLAPTGYSLVGKKIMIHDLSQPNTSYTKLIDVTDIGGGGGTGNPLEIVTYQEATDLATQDLLVPGQKYLITDANANLYGGTNIFISAATTSTFEIKGHGIFFNPDYANIPIWSPFSELTVGSETGEIEVGETITAQSGATGQVFAYNPQTHKVYFLILSGSWTNVTSITGATSGYTATVSFASIMDYPVGMKVIWGGKVWENINGVYGTTLDFFTLDDNEWTELDYTDASYLGAIDVVTYDFANDEIKYREDILLNKVTTNVGIRNFPWGNPYVSNNTMVGGSVELINYLGKQMFNNFFGEACVLTSPFILGDSGFVNCRWEAVTIDGMFMVDCVLREAYINANNVFLSNPTFINSPIEMRLTNSELLYKLNLIFDGTKGHGLEGEASIPKLIVPPLYSITDMFIRADSLSSTDDNTVELTIDLTTGSGAGSTATVDVHNAGPFRHTPTTLIDSGDDYLKMEIANGDVTGGRITFVVKFVNMNYLVS